MKKLNLLLAVLLFGMLFTQAQKDAWYDTTFVAYFNQFENPIEYIEIGDSPENIWQIGEPQKEIFNQAYSAPKAIVTDTLDYYPINNNSYFEIIIGEFNFPEGSYAMYPEDIFIDFWHKYDTDEGKDGGYLTVSWDNGETWMNVVDDTAYYSVSGYGAPETDDLGYDHSDSLGNGQVGFSGYTDDWVNATTGWRIWLVRNQVPDTMRVRFNFYSDAIADDKEGWMIDDIKLFSTTITGATSNLKNDPTIASINPNPVSTESKIQLNKTYQDVSVELFSANGRKISAGSYISESTIPIQTENLNPGLYLARIVVDSETMAVKKIVVK